MAVISLSGARRESIGKGAARKARAAGKIPGVLYGHGETPIPLAIIGDEFHNALRNHKGGNPVVSLAVEDGEFTALLRDVQYDPITHDILHLDFQHISLTETVEVRVPLHLTGVAVGVKDGGGILEAIVREVEVRCLPTAIPPSIDVDVSALNIGESIHVRDLSVPDVEIMNEPEGTIATVVPPTVVAETPTGEEAVAEVPVAAEGTEPEVIARGKKEEEEEGAKESK